MASKAFTAFDIDILGRSVNCIAQGALTNSKRPECFVKGVYPTHLTRGFGAYVWDTKGNRYIDFICGLGSNLMGYANHEINEEIAKRMSLGVTLSLGTDLEVEFAEKLKEVFTFIDKVKILKTGSDACTAAVRIARGKTGKALVLSEGYHGWHDEFVSLTYPAHGVTDHENIKPLKSALDIHSGVGAVIVEPVMTDMSEARIKWLKEIREECTRQGAVLIFDEVITGCRTPNFSMAQHLGIMPDLICLGKAIGGGLPISIVGGKSDLMEGSDYFVSSTFSGETLSIAASLKTLKLLQTGKYNLTYLWEKGAQFLYEFNGICPEVLTIKGYPTRGVFEGRPIVKALFFQECARAGILVGPSFFFNFDHITLMDPVLSTLKDILIRVKTGSVRLEGDMPVTPFAQKMRS